MNSVQDELELNKLMARYADAVNRDDADAWIATWAQDGEWNLLGDPVVGHDDILALWRQMMDSFEFALLLPSSCLYRVDGDRATGHCYLQEYSRTPGGEATAIISRYRDTCVRRNGQWLYHSRKYDFIYHGPPDLSGNFTRPS